MSMNEKRLPSAHRGHEQTRKPVGGDSSLTRAVGGGDVGGGHCPALVGFCLREEDFLRLH